MRTNFFPSIRWKIIGYFVLSIILAVLSVAAASLFTLFISRLRIEPFYTLLAKLYNATNFFGSYGQFMLILFVGIVFVFLYFLLLSRGLIRYFEEVSNSLDTIAKGDLSFRIPVRTGDEVGTIAKTINSMTSELESTINEERRAQKTKQELITNVSHDLRTPLTSIMGYLDLIENDHYRDEVELRHYTQIVYSKAQRLKNMIDSLFEYTKLQGGGIKVNFEKINIGELLEQLVTEFLPMLEKEGVKARTFPAEEKFYVDADGDMLARVFENLLSNAARYGKEGKYVDIKWREEDKEVVIEIINYGPSIPAKDLPYIFERFYRVEKSRTGDTGGTGLGLAISKNMVEINNGKIAAYSNQNSTSFEVRLQLQSDVIDLGDTASKT